MRPLALVVVPVLVSGCLGTHRAPLHTAPPEPPHSHRLWLELRSTTEDTQCKSAAGQQPLCFEEVREATARSLVRVLSSSFPEVLVRKRGDVLGPHEYFSAERALDARPLRLSARGRTGERALGRVLRVWTSARLRRRRHGRCCHDADC
jgi:hypothetical protein